MRDEKGRFIKGNIPWHKGKKNVYTKEVILNMSRNHKGLKMTEEHKKKISEGNKGISRGLGKTSGFKGHKHSEEAKKRMSTKRLGNTYRRGKSTSLEGRKKLALAQQNKSVFTGFITPFERRERVRFRNEVQKLVFERDDYTCQICKLRGVALQVDHIQSWAEYEELRFSMDNCRTVCMKCHYKITYGREMPKEIKSWGHNLKQITEGGFLN